MNKFSNLFINILIGVGTIIILTLLFEVGLRSFYLSPNQNPRVPHPIFGWIEEPNAQYIHQTPEYRNVITINSKGWRDVEHGYPKPENTFRIVILGDSFMAAKSVELEDAFPRQLENLIKGSGILNQNIEVINISTVAYSTIQEYLVFVEEGIKYDPDLVILAFTTGNDVRSNSYDVDTTIFGEKNFNVISRPYLKPGSNDEWEIIEPQYEEVVKRIEARNKNRSWWGSSAIYQLYTQAKPNLEKTFAINNIPNSTSDNKRQANLTDPYLQWGVFLCEPSPKYVEAWNITERILVRLANDIEKQGAQFFVFTIPADIEVHEFTTNQYLETLTKPDDFCLDYSTKPFIDLLKRNNILHLDLMPIFRDELQTKELSDLYRTINDRHWNEGGHTLATQAVYKALLQHGLFSSQ